MEKIQILRIITRLNIGGPAIHTLLLNSEMNEYRFENILVTGKVEEKESDMMYLAKEYKVTPIFISEMNREIRMLQDFISFLKLYKLIRNINPDVVHTHTAKAGSLGRLAAYFDGSKYIVHTFHGNIFKGYFSKRKTKILLLIERILAKITTIIIAISNQQKNELLDLEVTNCDKIKIIHLEFVDFSDLLKLYALAEIFFFPSIYEGFGFPPLEAASLGSPSVVSNASSIPEICGDAVLYFNPFDKEDIKAKIYKVQNNKGVLEKYRGLAKDNLKRFY